jgi:hypothetical protein
MGMREKLIELFCNAQQVIHVPYGIGTKEAERYIFQQMAEHLIANGVTIAKWIPVTERLPEEDVLVLRIGARGGMFLGRSPSLFRDGTAYFAVPNARSCRYATYWMPLPQPPKGE